jgi:predicted MPP superfamily phosphohydrolase
LQALSELHAPLGVYAVPGNHDLQDQSGLYHEAIASTRLIDLTNRSKEIVLSGESLWLAGVDDLWRGRPNLPSALAGIPQHSAVILLCHNPDFMEEVPDARVGLALCGHTHGGQIYLPAFGSPWIPSKYGEKYRHGLVQGPRSQVFVSRGLGEAGVPLRMNALPEINFITLRQG